MRRALLLASLVLGPALVGCVASQEPLQKGVTKAGPHVNDHDEPPYAPVGEAAIRPGVSIHTPKRDCASNFLFAKTDNSSLFLGTTANCFRDMPVGTFVTVGGKENRGMLVYSSWESMEELKEKDADAREYNDFAVVRVDPDVRAKVNPAILHYGGPTGMADPTAQGVGTRVKSYVNASADLPEPSAWREGVVTGRVGAWALLVHSVLPATPGGMGGPVLTTRGEALGVIVNVGVLPNPGANGVARLDALMAYALAHANLDMHILTSDALATGPV
jgi:hypothetical protein